MRIPNEYKRSIEKLRYEATDKCFQSKSEHYMTIMAEMIAKAYMEGVKDGAAAQREISRSQISFALIPEPY